MRNVLLAPLVVFAIAFQAAPPAKPEVPTLTDLQRLQVQTITLRLENAQLKAQLAQADFDKARKEFGELVTSLQKDGFTLDLQTLTYAPKPKAEKEK